MAGSLGLKIRFRSRYSDRRQVIGLPLLSLPKMFLLSNGFTKINTLYLGLINLLNFLLNILDSFKKSIKFALN